MSVCGLELTYRFEMVQARASDQLIGCHIVICDARYGELDE
jgi:hypothetical protein